MICRLVNFDAYVFIHFLQTRIQSAAVKRRRPPTREGRLQLARYSGVDFLDDEGEAKAGVEEAAVSPPTIPESQMLDSSTELAEGKDEEESLVAGEKKVDASEGTENVEMTNKVKQRGLGSFCTSFCTSWCVLDSCSIISWLS